MEWLVFIPFLIGSIIGLAFVMMILARCAPLSIDHPHLLNRVAQAIALGNREKALLLLERDNHPVSTILSFALNLSPKDPLELMHAFEYAREEMKRRLTRGTSTLSWLTITIPIATLAVWIAMPSKPNPVVTLTLGIALIAQIIFWNVSLVYVKVKSENILLRAEDHFKFFSGLFLDDVKKNPFDIEGLIDDQQDIVDISSGLRKTTKKR